jgi:Ca2+-binding EF-hand superfamily protein
MSPRRAVSGAFSQLNPALVRELKEAFTLLDKDGNGTVDRTDLEEMLVSLGQDPTNEQLDEMVAHMPQPLTFSSYLTEMSTKLLDLSSRADLLTALEVFKHEDEKAVDADLLKASLLEYGMTSYDVERALGGFVQSSGFSGDMFMYRDFVDMLRGEAE